MRTPRTEVFFWFCLLAISLAQVPLYGICFAIARSGAGLIRLCFANARSFAWLLGA